MFERSNGDIRKKNLSISLIYLYSYIVMDQATFRRYGIWTQIGLIVAFFFVNLLEVLPYCTTIEAIVLSFNYTAMVATVVYVHYIYIFPLYFKGKRWIYFIAIALLMTVAIFLSQYINEVLIFEEPIDDD